MEKNQLAERATEELDEVIRSGYFGNTSRELLKKRNLIPRNDFLYDCIASIFNVENDGKQGVAGITLRLIDLYCEAIPHNPQGVIDVLSSFNIGTNKNPELENISSYLEYSVANQGWNNYTSEHRGQIISDVQKKQQAMRILDAYTKGVEYVGKAFTQLIAIEKIKREEEFDIYNISEMTIYKKMEEFKKLSDIRFHILTDIIDRKIRNADSHLNATYFPRKQEYVMKSSNHKGKIDVFNISIQEMLTSIYPKVNIFIQGFFSSCIIMVFNWSDRELANKTLNSIVNINDGKDVEW